MALDGVDIDIGVCALSDYDEDGVLQVQTDSPGLGGEGGTTPAPAIFPLGFCARPLDPDKGGDENGDVGLGASCVVITLGSARYVLPLMDPRDLDKIPKNKKGGTTLVGGAGEHRSFVAIDGEDPKKAKKPGSITIAASYSKGGKKKTLGVTMNVRDEGKEAISLVHGNGQRVTLSENGVVVSNAKGDSYFQCGDDGNVLAGDSKVQGSMIVGQQLAAMPVALGPVVAQALTALAAFVATLPSGTAAPAAIAPFLKLLQANHLKST